MFAGSTLPNAAVWLIVAITIALVGCQSPTEPTFKGYDSEDGASLYAACFGDGSRALRCSVLLQSVDNTASGSSDMTTRAEWLISDSAVIKEGTAPNESIAVAPGDAFVTAHDHSRSGMKIAQPVTVFPGTQPLPTFPINGREREGTQIIRDAVVRISDGLVSGRTAAMGSGARVPASHFTITSPCPLLRLSR